MVLCFPFLFFFVFFFNDTATTEIYTLSLHDALPIQRLVGAGVQRPHDHLAALEGIEHPLDRKSTRLYSSHANISYAVFCLKKKKKNKSALFNTQKKNKHKKKNTK